MNINALKKITIYIFDDYFNKKKNEIFPYKLVSDHYLKK